MPAPLIAAGARIVAGQATKRAGKKAAQRASGIRNARMTKPKRGVSMKRNDVRSLVRHVGTIDEHFSRKQNDPQQNAVTQTRNARLRKIGQEDTQAQNIQTGTIKQRQRYVQRKENSKKKIFIKKKSRGS